MADSSSLIPAGVLLDLGDQILEKQQNAAREIAVIIKQFALSGEHDKISAVINLLTSKFALSPQANLRKINEFVKLGVEKLEPYYAEILGVISPYMSDEKEEIRVAACEINEAIRSIHANPADGCKKDDD
ncbi:hypothetical protein ZIOFF_076201 [Zingiber officinale]|uniref:Uncharacterized protein n=1 Tax=Zingiber officinale TaxID=94328 RepID=A0A8J5BRY7_ZINOF|nr:hypothetical protein ZIOFF_076201 [Zingiber officinale]